MTGKDSKNNWGISARYFFDKMREKEVKVILTKGKVPAKGLLVGVDRYNIDAANGNGINIGILVFASKLLKLVNIVAGLLIFVNFVSAGYTYITSAGNTSLYTEIKEKLTFSVVGIVIIVAAYTGAALLGLIFFGDPSFILNPDLVKYGALTPP